LHVLPGNGGWYAIVSNDDAAQAIAVMNILANVSASVGALVIASDHPGKDVSRGSRGSSAKAPALDTQLMLHGNRDVAGTPGDLRMVVDKQKDG